MRLPVAKVLFTKEARYVVLRSRVGFPKEAGVGECVRGSFVRFRVRPLDTESEGFGSRSLRDFSCQLERLGTLYWAKHRERHSWAVAAVVGGSAGRAGGWTSTRRLIDHYGERTDK